jgi:toxin ParE1/3/4
MRDIRAFIARDNPGAADRIAARIRGVRTNLSQFPMLGPAIEPEGTRELAVTGTSYVVLDRVTPELVEILRVMHGARLWPPEDPEG